MKELILLEGSFHNTPLGNINAGTSHPLSY